MYRSPTPRSVCLLACLLLSLARPPAGASPQDGWHAVGGPDGDFTLRFPAPPSRGAATTPQRYFVGQTVTSYSAKTGEEHLFIVSYKDLPARFVSFDRQSLLVEYERGLLIDAWSIVSKESLPDGGWQYEAVTPLQVGSFRSLPKGRLRARVYFRGARMYTLSVASSDPDSFPAADAERFFSSLRFLKTPPTPPAPRGRQLTAREASAARGALRALRRLAAAEAVAPTYEEYGRLLLSAKGEVDDHLSEIGPGEVKSEIELALRAYTDLRLAWSTTKGFLAMPAALYEPQRSLILRYGIPIDTRGDAPLMDFKGAMFAIFRAAREHTERAAALLGQ